MTPSSRWLLILLLLIDGGTTIFTIEGLSVSQRQQNFVLMPWSGPSRNDNDALGHVLVDYQYESVPILSVSAKVASGLDTESITSVRVPIPKEEGNLASSLWPASCLAAVWWCKYGPTLIMKTTVLPDADMNNEEEEEDDDDDDDNSSSSFRILELGSGLGVTGWMTAAVACRQCANVSLWLTDQDDEALQRLAASPKYNEDEDWYPSIHVTSQYLDWRDEHASNDLRSEVFDVVVGSDLAYYHYLVGPLADTIESFAAKNDALVVLSSSASRKSIWDFYHLIRDGGYNVKRDLYGDPWAGKVRMLLYRLQDEEEQSTTPMVVLCWTSDREIDQRLQLLIRKEKIYVATDEDEHAIDKYF
jgi:hypothetical protein